MSIGPFATLPEDRQTNESAKFELDSNNNVAIRVKQTDTLRNRELQYANTLDCVKTSIGTTATLIVLPDNCNDGIILFHKTSSGIVYLGKDNSITGDGNTVLPLIENTYLYLDLKKNTEIYGIVSSGTIQIYCAGVIKQ